MLSINGNIQWYAEQRQKNYVTDKILKNSVIHLITCLSLFYLDRNVIHILISTVYTIATF